MNRRTHIKRMAGLAGALLVGSSAQSNSMTNKSFSPVNQGTVMTITGEIQPSQLGLTLPHERLFSSLGKEPARYPSYPEKELKNSVILYLKKLKRLGDKINCANALTIRKRLQETWQLSCSINYR